MRLLKLMLGMKIVVTVAGRSLRLMAMPEVWPRTLTGDREQRRGWRVAGRDGGEVDGVGRGGAAPCQMAGPVILAAAITGGQCATLALKPSAPAISDSR